MCMVWLLPRGLSFNPGNQAVCFPRVDACVLDVAGLVGKSA